MDNFTKEISDLINEEINKKAEKMFKERLRSIVVNLARDLNIDRIACHTQLSVEEVRQMLQQTVDIYNNTLKLCGQTENFDTIESFFHLDKDKSTVKIEENKEWFILWGIFPEYFWLIKLNGEKILFKNRIIGFIIALICLFIISMVIISNRER